MRDASGEEDVGSYPSKPMRIVVGFAAGGGNDLVARIVGPKLSERLGQPVIIENRPGASGQLAVSYVQGQAADGYTLLIGATGQLAIASAIYSNLPFHPTRTLVPLTLLGSYWLAIAGSTQHGIASLNDLVAFAKATPDKSNYPSSSPAFTIPAELFKLKTGIPAQTIPYKSTNEMMLSIAAGQTLFGFADPPIVIPMAQSGKIRVLAMTGPSRLPELPEARRRLPNPGSATSISDCNGSGPLRRLQRRLPSCGKSKQLCARLWLILPCVTGSKRLLTRLMAVPAPNFAS
jgi:tripartite-type tricarboxylate transporter receptor subunit TctC